MRYYCETWDMEQQRFTPQCDLPARHLPLWMLRRVLRHLRRHYSARKGDPAVSVGQDTFPLVPYREE